MLILFAVLVTIVEFFVARHMVKNFHVGYKQSLFMSLPFVIVIWAIAIIYT